MSIASIVASALGLRKEKHQAVKQLESDIEFFGTLRRAIEVERDPARKEELLKNAVAALKNGRYNVVAKMALAPLVDPKSDWDVIVGRRVEVVERSLEGDQIALSHNTEIFSRAQTELPILIANISNLAEKGRRADEGAKVWRQYQNELPKVEEALALGRAMTAEKNEGKKQALSAGIWTRAMDETLSPVARLEMLEPRNALVAQWKKLARQLADGADVARDLAGLKAPLERALTAKLASFAKETFGVAVS